SVPYGTFAVDFNGPPQQSGAHLGSTRQDRGGSNHSPASSKIRFIDAPKAEGWRAQGTLGEDPFYAQSFISSEPVVGRIDEPGFARTVTGKGTNRGGRFDPRSPASHSRL